MPEAPSISPPAAPPGDSERRYGGGRPGWALLRTVGDLYEAQLIRGVLEGAGLGPVVVEPIQTVGSWLLPSGHERVPQKIFVLAALVDASELALLDIGLDPSESAWDGPEKDVETRPHRGSRRTVRVALMLGFAAAAVSYLVAAVGGRTWMP